MECSQEDLADLEMIKSEQIIENIPKPKVLAEDHPLLEKFQQSLKAHLMRVQNQLLNEIADLDHNTKIKENEREDIGARLYDMQQQIVQQNQVIEEFVLQIKEVTEKRVIHEKNVEFHKKIYEDRLSAHKEAKRRHNERLMELNSLQVLENNIEKWSEEIDKEVATAKRIVSKDWQNQQAISEEKKQMDMVLFNLDMEVKNRERELTSVNDQIKEQNSVIEMLNNNLSDAGSDLEVLQQEHKRLTQGWREVIIAIQHRDKMLSKVEDEFRMEFENDKLLSASIAGTKKIAAKEMEQNEKLESLRERVLSDLTNLESQLHIKQKALDQLTSKINTATYFLNHTEKDFVTAKREGNALEVQLRAIEANLDKLSVKKIQLEDKILELAKDQITTDKASEHRMKLLRDTQDQRRAFEIKLSQVENQVSGVLLDLEKWKGILSRLREEASTLNSVNNETNSKADKLTDEMKIIESSVNMKLKLIDQLSKKLDNLINKSGGTEQSPTAIKIISLEKSIQETEIQIRELQNFWLMLQGHVVHLSEKRSGQMNDIQMARKQLMIIEQKTLKIDTELEEALLLGKDSSRQILSLNTKLGLLSAKLFEKRKSHEIGELECQHTHEELCEKLKDGEMSILKMEREIIELQNTIEQYKDVVLEKHREALSWETKYKMTEGMLRWRNEEKANGSEIGCMKTEIHRMDIRYNQLKRAQEKLVQDLEHCVMHREKIFTTASQRQKMDGSMSRLRSTIQQKLNDIKNKIKQAQNEINCAEISLNEMNIQYQRLLAETSKKQDDIESEKLQNNIIQADIEQGLLLKHKNLESIVRKQHRAKRYRALASVKVLPKFRPEGTIETEMHRQKETNDNLTEIVQNLLTDFSEKKYFLARILQSLNGD